MHETLRSYATLAAQTTLTSPLLMPPFFAHPYTHPPTHKHTHSQTQGRKAVGNSGFDKKAVHEALRSCATLAETTPRQRARHASWLMQRVVSKGWDPTLAHFNAFLNVLEHNPPRYGLCAGLTGTETRDVFGLHCVFKSIPVDLSQREKGKR